MPDIAMCHGEGCAKRDECYRHRAQPSSFRQAYFIPTLGLDGTCHEFIPLRDRSQPTLRIVRG